MTRRRQHAHYEPEEAGWISRDDFMAVIFLLAFFGLFIAITAVDW